MSAVIEALKVSNFEGYKDAEFPFSAGLNIIIGRNSTGKSTILDALGYALFGEAPEGVDKKLLVSRLPGSGNTAAYIKFRSPKTGEFVEVEREGKLDARGGYRKESLKLLLNGNEISLEGDDDFRTRITTLLGASYKQFRNLVYVRQGHLTSILEPKTEHMDSILGITLLRELREQFNKTREQLDNYEGHDVATEIQTIQAKILPQYVLSVANLASEIPPLQEEVGKLQELVKKGESKELQTLLKQLEEKKTLDTRTQDITSRTQELLRKANSKTLDEVGNKRAEYAKQHLSLKEEIGRESKIRDQLHDAWTNTKGKTEALEDQINKHEKLLKKGLTKCPNCGENTSISDAETRLESDKNKLNELKTKRATYIREHKDLTDQIRQQSKDRDHLRDEWTKAKGTAEALEEHITQHEKLLKKGTTRCPTCGQPISASKFRTQLQNDKTQLARLKPKVTETKRKYDGAETVLSQLDEKRGVAEDTVEELDDQITEQQELLKKGLTRCACGQTISRSKIKTQLQADKSELKERKKQTKKAKEAYDQTKKEVSDLEDKRRDAKALAETLEQYAKNVAEYDDEKERIAQQLETKLKELRSTLSQLNLPMDPQEPTFERTLASQIPISQADLDDARTKLEKNKQTLKEKKEQEEEAKQKKNQEEAKLKELKLRLEKASLARQLSEGFEQAIEERRRNQLKSVELRALQDYNNMTDQHTYSAITIEPESYRVYVHPKGLIDRIPATRIGGGHQTLISLAIHLALLQMLNFRSLLILDEPTYGVDDQNLPQLENQLEQASKHLSQTIIVTHHGICQEDAMNIINVAVGEDGISRVGTAQ